MYTSKPQKFDASNVTDNRTVMSGIPVRNKRPTPQPIHASSVSNVPKPRTRSTSNASTTSSVSAVTPFSASTNGSPTSVNLPASLSANGHSPHSGSSESGASFPSPLPRAEYAFAMHDYMPQQQNATCLPFRAGQVILVLNKDPSGWWDGELEGRRGWFPSNYVNGESEYLLNESSQAMRRTNQMAGQDRFQNAIPSDGAKNYGQHDVGLYWPSLMVQLISVFTVMQDAVHKLKVTHYLPSARHIVKHVQTILVATGTNDKTAPVLQQYPQLALERRALLKMLSPLIQYAQQALAVPPSIEHDVAVEAMMRCAVEIINRSRRLLIVGAHCGLDIPNPPPPDGSAIWSIHSTDASNSPDSPTEFRSASDVGDIGRTPTQGGKGRQRPMTPRVARPTKSLGDLRSATKSSIPTLSKVPPIPLRPPQRDGPGRQKQQELTRQKSKTSLSSASSSSFSTQDTKPKQPGPSFPCGPATASQILDAFIYTHDLFLSTNAAFIGQTHAYSQVTHASNKVRLYELGNEIIDLACKLLALADSILQHPDILRQRLDLLRSSQQTLFQLVNSFAGIIHSVASASPSAADDEQQKKVMFKASTDSIKAGADCLSSARICLSQLNSVQKSFIVKPVEARDRQSDFADNTIVSGAVCNEDDTVQIQSFPFIGSSVANIVPDLEENASLRATSTTRPSSPVENRLRPITVPESPVEPDFPSPTSLIRTDDGTTWEGSTRSHYADRIPEERRYYGELPPAPIGFMPQFPVSPQIWFSHDYGQDDVAYNREGLLVGATLEALVEKMTPHDSIVDSAFSAVFFLTFRLFSTALELVDKVIERYNIVPPENLSQEDMIFWEQRKGLPVRLRISNFIKIWVEFYWRPAVDDVAIPLLTSFLSNELSLAFPGAAHRILELLDLRQRSPDSSKSVGGRIRDPGMSINPPVAMPMNAEIPRPVMTKALLVSLRKRDWSTISITDFDATELSRQLTIMECNLYCAIQPEEMLETGQQGAAPPLNVKAVTSLSTVITGWVAECILNEADIKKRSLIIKFFIKVADRCMSLSNYSTPRAMLAALDSSTISRLRQTWLAVSQKHKSMLESLRRLADHGRNYHEYRSRLRNTAPPAVPFLGLYLTDVTFCREGNPSHRTSPTNANKSLLNFNKYHKLARIVQDMQRFQVPYNLKAIPEIQDYLTVCFENARGHGDLQDLYRRSLLVEPKQPADSQTLGEVRQLFSWATRSQSQAQAQATTS